MADNVAVSSSATYTVATDEVAVGGTQGTAQVQFVKLVDGTLNGTAVIPGDATNGLYVQVKDAVSVLADGAAFTQSTSKVTPIAFLADDTSTDIVTENDIGAARMTLDRRQIVQLGESAAKDVIGGGSKTDSTDQAIMAAGGAGVYNYLQWVTVYNASSTNTYVNVKDGSTVRAVLPLPAYGGCMFMPPRPLRGTANTAWNLACPGAVTTAYMYGGGYTSTG